MKKTVLAFVLIIIFVCLGQTEAFAAVAYKIKKGDTLWGLSRKHGTTVARLWALNPQIKDPHWIYAGHKMSLPGKKISKALSKAQSEIKALKTQIESLANENAKLVQKNQELGNQIAQNQKVVEGYQRENSNLLSIRQWADKIAKAESANRSIKVMAIIIIVMLASMIIISLLLWRRYVQPIDSNDLEMHRADGRVYIFRIRGKPKSP